MTLKQSLFFAVLLHLGILSFLIVELRFTVKQPPVSVAMTPKDDTPIIHATTVNQRQIEKQMAVLQQEERQRDLQKQQQLEKMQQAALDAKRQQEEAKQQFEQLKQDQAKAAAAEKERLDALKQEQAKEQQKLQQLQLAAKQEQQKQEKLAQEKLAQEKLAQEKLAQEKKTQALALAAQQKKNLMEQAQKKKQAEEAERLLQQQLASERQQLNAAKEKQINNELLRYTMLIKQSISQHWNVPQTSAPNLSCVLFIRLAENGQVMAVQLIKSSGDPLLDRSAEAAVYKASPLPMSDNLDVAQRLREIRLTVSPSSNLV